MDKKNYYGVLKSMDAPILFPEIIIYRGCGICADTKQRNCEHWCPLHQVCLQDLDIEIQEDGGFKLKGEDND